MIVVDEIFVGIVVPIGREKEISHGHPEKKHAYSNALHTFFPFVAPASIADTVPMLVSGTNKALSPL